MKQNLFKGIVLSLALCLCCLIGTHLSLPTAALEEPSAVTVTEEASPFGEAAPDEAGAPTREEVPLSAELAALIKEHAPTILSAASLLLMTAITLFFKKGVLPRLLSLFESLFKKSGETLSSLSEHERAVEERLSSLLARGEAVFKTAEGIKDTEGALRAALLESQTVNERFSSLFSEQSALLFELLMSANLPQYQKDRVASVRQRTEAYLASLSIAEEAPTPEKEG